MLEDLDPTSRIVDDDQLGLDDSAGPDLSPGFIPMPDVKTMLVPGAEALEEMARIRRDFRSTGMYPILVGSPEDRKRTFPSPPKVAEDDEEQSEHEAVDRSEVEPTLALAAAIDVDRWFDEHRAEQLIDRDEEEQDILGDWPNDPHPKTAIQSHLTSSGKPLREVLIALVPVQAPWEVFAHLKFGGWNECPSDEEHVAIHKRWFEQYGAEVFSVTGDSIECIVARPPVDRDAALILAREQFVYCLDIVEQGAETISNLAAILINSDTWFFWWD